MNVNLEAEQVVKEEEESAPGKKRNLLGNKKVLIIVGAVVILEAIVLFGLFSAMGGDSGSAQEPRQRFDGDNFADTLKNAYSIQVGPVSIYDEAVTGPGADRRFTASVDIWLKKEAQDVLTNLVAENPMALTRLQRMMEREIRVWMLQQGGQQLKNREFQEHRDSKLKDHLDVSVPLLETMIEDVHIHSVSAARF